MHAFLFKCFGRSKLCYRGFNWKNLHSPSERLASFGICGAFFEAPSTFHHCKWFGRIRVSASVFSFVSDETFFLATKFREYFLQPSLAIMAFLFPRCFSKKFFSYCPGDSNLRLMGGPIEGPHFKYIGLREMYKSFSFMYCQLMQVVAAHY